MNELADISIHARLAEAYAAQGDYELALQFFKQLNSDHPDMLFKHGLTAYHANRKDIAINTWKRVIELDSYYHTAYYELAKTYDEEGHINEAFEICKQGLSRDEHNKELYFLAGKLANKLGKHEACLTYISEAIAIDHDYKEAIMFIINIWKNSAEYERIISFLTDIKNNGAQDPFYDWEIARAYNEIESFDKANENYAEAYNNFQQDSEFLKEYGYFLVEDGKIKHAIEILEAYTQLEPLDAEVEDYVDRLKQTTD